MQKISVADSAESAFPEFDVAESAESAKPQKV